jgi:hypothetical protein
VYAVEVRRLEESRVFVGSSSLARPNYEVMSYHLAVNVALGAGLTIIYEPESRVVRALLRSIILTAYELEVDPWPKRPASCLSKTQFHPNEKPAARNEQIF